MITFGRADNIYMVDGEKNIELLKKKQPKELSKRLPPTFTKTRLTGKDISEAYRLAAMVFLQMYSLSLFSSRPYTRSLTPIFLYPSWFLDGILLPFRNQDRTASAVAKVNKYLIWIESLDLIFLPMSGDISLLSVLRVEPRHGIERQFTLHNTC